MEKNNLVPVPEMNVLVSNNNEVVPEIANSDQIINICQEALSDIRDNTKEIDEKLQSFTDMVMNEGDATSSSKEALINLIKMKTDQTDKKIRILELLSNAFLKQKYTQPKIFSAHQHNEFKIEDRSGKKKLLKELINENDK